MTGLLWRALRSRGARPWLAAGGVAISTLMVLVLVSAYRSVRGSMAAYAGQETVDLWVAPAGSDNLIRGSFASLISYATLDSIRQVPGVARADPVLKAFLAVRPLAPADSTRRLTLLAIGYRVPDGLGGPPVFADGRPPKGRREAALDRAAAWRLHVRVGDTVAVGIRKVTVTGLTRGTNILATQFLFADIAAAAASTATRDKASFAAVRLAPGTRVEELARELETRFPELTVLPRAAFLAANQREVSAGFVPLLTLVGALGVAAAAVLVGLLVHAVAEERRADLAVLFALGAEGGAVGRGMLGHAMMLVLLGALAGTAAACGLAILLDRLLPTIPLEVAPGEAAAVSGLFMAAGMIAATVPVLRLRRLDPMDAFRP
jgi:hypothetical protein